MTFKDIIYVGRRSVSQSPSGWGDVILGVEQNGDLRWSCYFGNGKDDISGSTGWHQNSGNRIGNGWNGFRHLVGVDDGVILAVEQNGDLRWYRYQGNGEDDVTGSTGWHQNSSNRIGNGWNGFKNIFIYPLYGPDGIGAHQIFGVEQNGDLRWYGYKGNGEDDVTGSTGWDPNSRNFIGNGWQSFLHLAGGGGVTFGVEQDGTLKWYRYGGRGINDISGATGWLTNSGNPIGNGWNGFRHIFVGAHPGGLGGWTIYGVEQNGDLRWYNYHGKGESDISGSTGWHQNSRNFIGNGW